MNIIKKLAAVAALSCAPMVASAATLITNGGFETGDLSGWTCAGADSCIVQPFIGKTGAFGLQGYDNSGFATLSQTIATVSGKSYDFSFWSSATRDSAANIAGYSLDGGATVSFVASTFYTQITDSFVASGGSALISLFFETDFGTGTHRIDDVSVVGVSAVPLPAGGLLLLAGLGGLAAFRRQKKSAA